MKKGFLIFFLIMSIQAQAQKGFELKVNGGLGFLGKDPWIETGFITGRLLYNFNGVLAIGPTYSQGFNTTFRIESDANQTNASLYEVGLITQITVIRAGKIKVYGSGSITNMQGKTDPVMDFIYNSGETLVLDDATLAFGLGVGVLLNLGSGFYLNILDFQMRFVNSEFMDMDKGFAGKIGPGIAATAGISYAF